MSIWNVGRQHHNHSDPWAEAPPWAVELGSMMLVVIAKLNKLQPGNLTPEQQAAIEKIYNIEVSDKQKVDAALSKS